MTKIKTSPEVKAIKTCLLKEYPEIKTKKDFRQAIDRCIISRTTKEVEYNPVRNKGAEEPGRHLIRWYEDRRTGAIASFWDEPRNAHMRVSTEKGSDEIGFPFATLKNQPESWFKRTAVKYWKMLDKK